MNPTWWEGLLLGLVQGLTEFLPISSSGHLVLAGELLGFRPPGLYFEVVLHVATLLSVILAYGARVRALLRGLAARDSTSWRYLGLLVLASLPAAGAGFLLRDFFAQTYDFGPGIGVAFLCTAALLWSTRYLRPLATRSHVTVRAALAMGAAQALAIFPAVSRSGTTIAAGLWTRLAPVPAAEFSFLMSLAAVAGSVVVELPHLPAEVDLLAPGFVIGFVAALLSGIWAIRFLVALLRKGRFHLFAGYCATLGIATLWWSL
jgi:undecaprenyl-diphosphatase